jgi:hypothetical protein
VYILGSSDGTATATFEMSGGAISGNDITVGGGGNGGGVYVPTSGVFVMGGGTIYGNEVAAPLKNSATGAALYSNAGSATWGSAQGKIGGTNSGSPLGNIIPSGNTVDLTISTGP